MSEQPPESPAPADRDTRPDETTTNPVSDEQTDKPQDAGQTSEARSADDTPAETVVTSPSGGTRVTRRSVHRRESEEHTEETITEDLPVYQGPTSTHPAPVG